jgi:hypothetical protein
MATRYVRQFFPLGDGKKAGRLVGNHDPRSYRPPRGFSAVAELIEFHPVTQRYLGESQWWMFLLPDTLNTVLSAVYLSELDHDAALKRLMALDSQTLAEALLDCFHRGGCRFLFCNEEGRAHDDG